MPLSVCCASSVILMAVGERLNAGTQHPHPASPHRTAHTMTSDMARVFHSVEAVAAARTLTLYSTAIVSSITTRCTHLSIFTQLISILSPQCNTSPALVSQSPCDVPWSRSRSDLESLFLPACSCPCISRQSTGYLLDGFLSPRYSAAVNQPDPSKLPGILTVVTKLP
jgi:hypothetical protein